MKRSRWILCAVAFGGAVLLIAGLWLMRPRSPINEASFQLLEEGMTKADVEAILQGSSRDDSSGKLYHVVLDESLKKLVGNEVLMHPTVAPPRYSEYPKYEKWISNRAIISVGFDEQKKVVHKACIPVYSKSPGPLALLRKWLRI